MQVPEPQKKNKVMLQRRTPWQFSDHAPISHTSKILGCFGYERYRARLLKVGDGKGVLLRVRVCKAADTSQTSPPLALVNCGKNIFF